MTPLNVGKQHAITERHVRQTPALFGFVLDDASQRKHPLARLIERAVREARGLIMAVDGFPLAISTRHASAFDFEAHDGATGHQHDKIEFAVAFPRVARESQRMQNDPAAGVGIVAQQLENAPLGAAFQVVAQIRRKHRGHN